MPEESISFQHKDVKPYTPIATLDRRNLPEGTFPISIVAGLVGMQPSFINKVIGSRKTHLTSDEVTLLLDQDAFAETYVPRSRILGYLAEYREINRNANPSEGLLLGSALNLIPRLPYGSIQTVVTSTPYWAMRIYEDAAPDTWADGETCPYGMEQTPEGFIRHSVELLVALMPAMKSTGSIWWNLGDTYNTRTQIRGNAAEALRAMRGGEAKGWHDHVARRYSAGHSYLKDGEQTLIPQRIAERASKAGLYVKSIVSWGKTHSMPEPQKSRVSRAVEYVIHFSMQRTPEFDRGMYLNTPAVLGGRTPRETDKLSDSWLLSPSSGQGGHGAQFPIALPGRCISLTSKPGDLILDPFMGSGTTAVAAEALDRKWLGFEISPTYVEIVRSRVELTAHRMPDLLRASV